MLFVVIKKMKTLKIALAFTAIIAIVAVTIGLAFAQLASKPYITAQDQAQDSVDQDWWVRMRSYMKARWNGIEDEEWFEDMNQYMEEHWNEVQNQEWFSQMLEYMQEHGYYNNYGYSNYGYGDYGYNYFGLRGCGGRGFGCGGW